MWIKVSCAGALPNKNWQLHHLTGDMVLIKLVFDYLGGLLVPADTNIKHKCFRFDGHDSMLQLCAGIQAEKHWSRSQRLALNPVSAADWIHKADWFRNCRASQNLRPFLFACVTVSPAGIPPWLQPKEWSNLWSFFPPAFFGWITELKPHVSYRPFRKVAFGTRTAERQPSHTASHFNGRKTCGVQTPLSFTVIQTMLILTGGLWLKQVTQCSP